MFSDPRLRLKHGAVANRECDQTHNWPDPKPNPHRLRLWQLSHWQTRPYWTDWPPKGQTTVIAPTDAAFEAAFEELKTLGIDPDEVLADTDLLTLILDYPISPGCRCAEDALDTENVRMRDGGFLSQEAGMLTDNLGREATITATDVEACNGIIHVIDNVVLPGLP